MKDLGETGCSLLVWGCTLGNLSVEGARLGKDGPPAWALVIWNCEAPRTVDVVGTVSGEALPAVTHHTVSWRRLQGQVSPVTNTHGHGLLARPSLSEAGLRWDGGHLPEQCLAASTGVALPLSAACCCFRTSHDPV